jgi:hypothetical protein
MKHRGPPKKRKKLIQPSSESSIVPVDPTPKKCLFLLGMNLYTYILYFLYDYILIFLWKPTFYYSQGTSVSLSSGNSLRYFHFSAYILFLQHQSCYYPKVLTTLGQVWKGLKPTWATFPWVLVVFRRKLHHLLPPPWLQKRKRLKGRSRQ